MTSWIHSGGNGENVAAGLDLRAVRPYLVAEESHGPGRLSAVQVAVLAQTAPDAARGAKKTLAVGRTLQHSLTVAGLRGQVRPHVAHSHNDRPAVSRANRGGARCTRRHHAAHSRP